MKKLLGFLAAFGLATTASTSVVACGASAVLAENNLTRILGNELDVQGEGDFLTEAQIKQKIKDKNPQININKITIEKKGLDDNNNYLYVVKGTDSTYTGQVVIHSSIVKQNLQDIAKIRDFESQNKLTDDELLARFAVENGIKYSNTLQIAPETNGEDATNEIHYVISPKENEDFYYTGSVVITYQWFVADAKVELGTAIAKREITTAKKSAKAGNKEDVFERIMMINNVSYWEELEIENKDSSPKENIYEISVKNGASHYNPNSAPIKIVEKLRDDLSEEAIDLGELELSAEDIDLGFNAIVEPLVRKNFLIVNNLENDDDLIFSKIPANDYGVNWTRNTEKWVVKAVENSTHYTGSAQFTVANHGVSQFDLDKLDLVSFDTGEVWAKSSEIIDEVNTQISNNTNGNKLDFAYLKLNRGEIEQKDISRTELIRERDWSFDGNDLGKKHYKNSAKITNVLHEFSPIDIEEPCGGIYKRDFASADAVINEADLRERIMVENGLEEHLRDQFTLTKQPKSFDNGVKIEKDTWVMKAVPGSKHMTGQANIETRYYSANQFDLSTLKIGKFTSVDALDETELLRRIVAANDLPTTKDLVLEKNSEKSDGTNQIVYTLKASRDTYFKNSIEIINVLHKVEKHDLSEYINAENKNDKVLSVNKLTLEEFEQRLFKMTDIAYVDEIQIELLDEKEVGDDRGQQIFGVRAKADSLHYTGAVTVINEYYTDTTIDLRECLNVQIKEFISDNSGFHQDDLLKEFVLVNELSFIDSLEIRPLTKADNEFAELTSKDKQDFEDGKIKFYIVSAKAGAKEYKGSVVISNIIQEFDDNEDEK